MKRTLAMKIFVMFLFFLQDRKMLKISLFIVGKFPLSVQNERAKKINNVDHQINRVEWAKNGGDRNFSREKKVEWKMKGGKKELKIMEIY